MPELNVGRRQLFLSALAAATATTLPMRTAHAIGGPSGATVGYGVQGNIGEIIVNPYKIAPLTAIIRNGGYELTEASVRILPKPNGQEIAYKVSRSELLTHGGIPVFGLYPDYTNTIEVSYTRRFHGEEKSFTERYQVYAAPVSYPVNGLPNLNPNIVKAKVHKVDPTFADRLYLINNLLAGDPKASRVVWNNPQGGALEWCYTPLNVIIDTKGEVRWYLHAEPIFDPETIWKSGIMMGFQQTAEGDLTWGYGQRYVKYDLLGREIYNRRLPVGYADFSHALDNGQNGHSFIRVASADHRRADNKRVHTVRDLIIEVDANGKVVDEFRLWEILDPHRSLIMKSLDQGAVCLNIDASKAGQTLSSAELAKLETSDRFGDIVGTGEGRNWAHVNSVDYDPSDDSIIISSRHQSAIVKIGRDKKVKWILAAPVGWREGWREKVLKPVNHKGEPIACHGPTCESDFDYTWTQHSVFRIDEKSNKDVIYITAFDNGDGRGVFQPEEGDAKYSRAVIYKIDQNAMTVEQVWEYGKERGIAWYSPITSNTKYFADKNSVVVYSATAGLGDLRKNKKNRAQATPYLEEFRWGEKEPAVEIQLMGSMGYQAMPIDLKKAFSK